MVRGHRARARGHFVAPLSGEQAVFAEVRLWGPVNNGNRPWPLGSITRGVAFAIDDDGSSSGWRSECSHGSAIARFG